MSSRLYIFARHAESTVNVDHVLNTDPTRPVALTSLGRLQAQRLGSQIANLEIDIAICTRFVRTRETAEIATAHRDIPVCVEPALDEIKAGAFDCRPIGEYWSWSQGHPHHERFPQGESVDEALARYAQALRNLLARDERVTFVVCHGLALRHIGSQARSDATAAPEEMIANAVPYLFSETMLRLAAERLEGQVHHASAAAGHADAA